MKRSFQKQNRCDVSGSLKQVDQFGEAFQMKLKEKDAVYKSLMGAFCSLIILVFLTTFSVTKLQTLFLKSDVDILQSKEEFLID